MQRKRDRGINVGKRYALLSAIPVFPKEKDARTLLYRRYGGFRYGEPVDLYTGDISTSLRCPNTADDRIVIFSSDPYPFCVCALIIDFSIQEV